MERIDNDYIFLNIPTRVSLLNFIYFDKKKEKKKMIIFRIKILKKKEREREIPTSFADYI